MEDIAKFKIFADSNKQTLSKLKIESDVADVSTLLGVGRQIFSSITASAKHSYANERQRGQIATFHVSKRN